MAPPESWHRTCRNAQPLLTVVRSDATVPIDGSDLADYSAKLMRGFSSLRHFARSAALAPRMGSGWTPRHGDPRSGSKGGKLRFSGSSTNGQEFERSVAARLSNLGWRVDFTAVSGDFGADLIAQHERETLVVQCKAWSSPVGISAVQEIYYAKIHYRADYALVVSRNEYTKAAITAARRSHVATLTENQLIGSQFDRSYSVKKRIVERELIRKKIEKRNKILFKNEQKMLSERNTSDVWHIFDNLYGRKILMRFVIEKLFGWARINRLEYFRKAALIPTPPYATRRGAIRYCPECETCLRLEFAKKGLVLCPICKNKTYFYT